MSHTAELIAVGTELLLGNIANTDAQMLSPRHPRLRPVLGELEAAEAALDVEGLVKAAVDGIERVQV